MNDYSTGTREDYFLSHIGLHSRHTLRLEAAFSSDSALGLEGAFQGFSAQACDSFSIASFTAASLAGRVARFGFLSSRLTLPLQNFFSHAFGLGIEAATLEGIQRAQLSPNTESHSFWHNWAQHYLNFATFKIVGAAGSHLQVPIQHLVQSFAMCAGHQVASAAGLEEASTKDLLQQFLDANVANLQIRFGNALSERLLNGRLQIVERSLESRSRLAQAALFPSAPRFGLPRFASHYSPEGNLGPEKSALYARFQELLRPIDPSTPDYSHYILLETLSVTGRSNEFMNNLLETYAQSPLCGTSEQYKIAAALAMNLRLRQSRSSSGSFMGSLIEEYVEVALSHEFSSARSIAMEPLFKAMQLGFPQGILRTLFSNFHAAIHSSASLPSHVSPAFEATFPSEGDTRKRLVVAGYGQGHQAFLSRWVEYMTGANHTAAARIYKCLAEAMERSPSEECKKVIREIIHLGQHHPLGLLVMRRFLHILASEDVEAKLREIPFTLLEFFPYRPDGAPVTRGNQEGSWRRAIHDLQVTRPVPDMEDGSTAPRRPILSPEQIAELLCGKSYAAFLKDIRLGRKLVSVAMDIPLDQAEIERRKSENIDAALRFLDTDLIPKLDHRSFNLVDLLAFLRQNNDNREIKTLMHQLRSGKFRIHMAEAEDFKSPIADCNLSFIEMHPEDKGIPLIIIRQIDALDPSDPHFRSQLHAQLVRRARALIHEWEHWRHLSGNYNDIESGGEAFQRNGNSRATYMTIEAMAHLEEERWGIFNDPYHMAHQLAPLMGISLATYYRNLADHTHFRETNERLARQILE